MSVRLRYRHNDQSTNQIIILLLVVHLTTSQIVASFIVPFSTAFAFKTIHPSMLGQMILVVLQLRIFYHNIHRDNPDPRVVSRVHYSD